MSRTMGLCISHWYARVPVFQLLPRYSVCCPPMCSIHTQPSLLALLCLCQYLNGTKTKGIIFTPGPTFNSDCYIDANFAGLWCVEHEQDPVCVKSHTGYCLTLGTCPVLWVSHLQTEIALSTTKAECIVLSQAMHDHCPMQALLQELGTAMLFNFSHPTLLHSTVSEDNNGALQLSCSPKLLHEPSTLLSSITTSIHTLALQKELTLSRLILKFRRLISSPKVLLLISLWHFAFFFLAGNHRSLVILRGSVMSPWWQATNLFWCCTSSMPVWPWQVHLPNRHTQEFCLTSEFW